MGKILKNNKGLSLVEVVVSALVVATLMAGIYAVYISSRNMTALAFHKAVALAWATSKLEGLKNGMPNGSYTDPSDTDTSNVLRLAPPQGKGAAIPTPSTTTYANCLREHLVTVNWTE